MSRVYLAKDYEPNKILKEEIYFGEIRYKLIAGLLKDPKVLHYASITLVPFEGWDVKDGLNASGGGLVSVQRITDASPWMSQLQVGFYQRADKMLTFTPFGGVRGGERICQVEKAQRKYWERRSPTPKAMTDLNGRLFDQFQGFEADVL